LKTQYDSYSIVEPSPSTGLPIGEKAGNAAQDGADAISGGPDLADAKVVSSEQRIEYRDEAGNLLNEEQIKSLQGKAEFRTRYETKTRLVDEQGVEVLVAPPHPDVEGDHKETIHAEDSSRVNQQASSSRDGEREAEGAQARPASEGKEATRKDEL
jgi:dolichyl-phosphate-mannose-protein mannosyltransferase